MWALSVFTRWKRVHGAVPLIKLSEAVSRIPNRVWRTTTMEEQRKSVIASKNGPAQTMNGRRRPARASQR